MPFLNSKKKKKKLVKKLSTLGFSRETLTPTPVLALERTLVVSDRFAMMCHLITKDIHASRNM
jgi:hypothetical protein